MKRKPDWEARLNAYLAEAFDRPYAYGKHDCLMFPANVVRAMTGTDLAKGHRGKYSSQISGARYLKKLDLTKPEQFIDQVLKRKPVGFAQRGDIVLGELPGVCFGDFALRAPDEGETGLVRMPRSEWRRAWAV